MTEIEQALKNLSEKNRAGLAQLQTQIENSKGSNSAQFQGAKNLQALFLKEQWLIDKARSLAGGSHAAIVEIEAVLKNRAVHAHTRMLAAMLLAMVDSVRALEILAGRIVDKSDTDTLRFFSAMQLANSRNAVACRLILEAINHPSTDEEFDENAKIRAKMIDEGLAVNLRRAMILGLLDSGVGTDVLAARVKAPLSFQNGWLPTLILLWQKTESEGYILLAAEVLKNRGNPETLRVNAATALYIMRRQSKGRSYFPKAAWDALRSVWTERDYGSLHNAVGEVLKLQGA